MDGQQRPFDWLGKPSSVFQLLQRTVAFNIPADPVLNRIKELLMPRVSKANELPRYIMGRIRRTRSNSGGILSSMKFTMNGVASSSNLDWNWNLVDKKRFVKVKGVSGQSLPLQINIDLCKSIRSVSGWSP